MASGALPKRVGCPKCGAPQGVACRDEERRPARKPHAEREKAAADWYLTPAPDGLTPHRRDQMVATLRVSLTRAETAKAMDRIAESKDSETQFIVERSRIVQRIALGAG